MEGYSLKGRIIIPLAVALILLLTAFVSSIYWVQQENIIEDVKDHFTYVQSFFVTDLEAEGGSMGAVLKGVLRDENLKAALLEKNRDALLNQTTGFFDQLHSEHEITHFYFSDANRINLLRVHKPDTYGDQIQRFTTLEAERTGEISYGLDLGPLGTFTLRVVTPWRNGEHLIGYVELGKEIEQLIDKLHSILGVELYVAIRKEFLDFTSWRDGMRMLGREDTWNQFPSAVMAYQTMEAMPADLISYLAKEEDHRQGFSSMNLPLDGRRFSGGSFVLRDAFGRAVGEMIFLRDITDRFANLYLSILVIALISLFVGGALCLSFYVFLSRVEKKFIERKQAEDRLRRSEEQYRSLFNGVPIGLYRTTPRGEILDCNPALMEVLGYPDRKDILAANAGGFYVDRKGFEQWKALAENTDSSYGFETRMYRYDGEIIRAKNRSRAVHDGAGQVLYYEGSLEDVTDHMEAVDALVREEEERTLLILAIEQAAEAIIITDTRGAILYVNPAFEKITGYFRKEALGKSPQILDSAGPEVALSLKLTDAISRGEGWSGHLSNRKKDGKLYEAEATISPVRDSTGKIINFVIVKRDVTNEMKLEKQLRQAQKMEAIGTLAGGIAHDFNNILGIIMGYTEITLLRLSKEEPVRPQLEEVYKAAHRAKDLVQQILTFSRKSEQEIGPVQVKPIIKEALKMLRATLPATIEIRRQIAADADGTILADPTQIHQILMNLCTNAYHAMKGKGGVLEVALDRVDTGISSEAHTLHPDLGPGPYLRLTVCDTGHGMNAATIERIFEPYFTTKPLGEGTGLGLSVVHGIVKSYGGAISVYSELGKGTAFHVYFPAMSPKVQKGREKLSASLPVGTERILLVDDEKSLVDIGRKMLERLGYVVTTRMSSVEALEELRARPDQYDLVVTDQTMPHMTGIELAGNLLSIRPDIPIILCTGFSEGLTSESAKAAGVREFLMKPLELRELADKIRKVLS